ncbi:MAG: TspO/MBR family protein [Candidatus Micrarchaeota archaeon]
MLSNFKIESPAKLLVSIVVCQLAGAIGSVFTISSIPIWYASLAKPSFSPPNWLFGPVWILLYLLMGIAVYLVWVKGLKTKGVKLAITAFVVQLFLNALWSIVFFGLQSPFYAFINIILLLATIVWTIVELYKLSKPAAYLMIPYLLWVCFATILNYSIWMLNA